MIILYLFAVLGGLVVLGVIALMALIVWKGIDDRSPGL